MNDYELILYADPKGPVGHFSVELMHRGESVLPVKGFYPKGEKVGPGNVDGEVRDDSKRVKEGKLYQTKFVLDENQAGKVREYLQDAAKNPEEYHLFSRNCVDFAQGALNHAGIKEQVADRFKEDELRDMGVLVGAGHDALMKANQARGGIQILPHEIGAEIGGWPGAEDGFERIREKQKEDKLIPERKSESGTIERSDLSLGAKKFIEDASQPGDDVEELMLKDPSVWTEEEARRVQGRVAGLPSGHPERGDMDQAVRTFYDRRYGTDEVDRDAAGRLIEPEARVSIPDKPSPLQTPDGEDLNGAARRIGEKIIKGAGDDDTPPPVKELQSGLNLINTEANPRRLLLKTDGTFGPKTRVQFRRALATNGPGKIEELLALGKFKALTEQARKSADASTLKEQTEKTFGPLFRGGNDHGTEKIEAAALQETLNEATDGRVEKLKVDGDIGPKTRNVFELASKINGPDDLSKRFGQMLGFLA